MGGSPLTGEAIKICLDILGVSGVENLYGMTEGILIFSGIMSEVSDIIKDGDVSIGTLLPGISVCIYDKDSKTLVRTRKAGEMYFIGLSLVKGYIGGADGNFYYNEDGCPQFCIGDKAFISSDNCLYLIRRYKDTIICGGENIKLSAIEAVLGQIPEISLFYPQVIYVPDNVTGEVPIIIVNQEFDDYTANKLRDTILAQMGDLYILADVISIQVLGYREYLRTIARKVQKTKLEDLVKRYW